MEKELNIAAILKDKPNAKLWSPIVGNCTFKGFSSKNGAIVASFVDKDGELLDWDFNEYGKTFSAPKEAEVCLFPSKSMRDWRKFAWKKGDVLISTDGKKEVFFNGFTDDTYALFKAKHGFEVLSDGNTMYLADEDGIATSDYTLEDKDAAQTYINTIEERLDGKLNRETLEVEANVNVGDVISDDVLYGICTKVDNSKVYCDFGCDSANYNAPITKLCLQKEYINVVMPANKEAWYKEIEKRHHISIDRNTLKVRAEFKDGDIVFMREVKSEFSANCIFILRWEYNGEGKALYHAFYNADDKFVCAGYGSTRVHYNLRLATDEEKQQLFEALAKKGKAWDAEKKQIVDLKPKYEFKPFDRCIWKIRNCEGSIWQASFISYVDEYDAVPIGVSVYDLSNLIVLPYNEQTKHLLGTTDEWKGDEHD